MGMYDFKQSLHIKPLDGRGVDYKLGVQEIPEAVEYDPQFLKFVGLGLIVEVDATKLISAESMHDRSKRLMDKLVAKRDAHKAKAEISAAPKAIEKVVPPVSEDEVPASDDFMEVSDSPKKKGKK